MIKYVVIWKPEYTNDLTVSIVDYKENSCVSDIMILAHEYEGLEFGGYNLHNIIKTTNPEVVW